MADRQTDVPAFKHIPTWLECNKNAFLPPVCNKLMHGPDGQLFVMYVGGPNQRKDFHLEEGEELFYMVKGDMCLRVQERGIFKDINIREGEIFLLPSRIPHSPQRKAETVGLVIERQRLPGEEDCIRYYMEDQTNILFERWLHCHNLGTQIAPVIKEFFASEEKATGKPTASSIEPRPPFLPNNKGTLDKPIALGQWLKDKDQEIQEEGRVRMFPAENYQTDVFVVGGCKEERFSGNPNAEFWVWQVAGETSLIYEEGNESDLESRHYRLTEDSAFLLARGKAFALQPVDFDISKKRSRTLVVMMDPANKARLVE